MHTIVPYQLSAGKALCCFTPFVDPPGMDGSLAWRKWKFKWKFKLRFYVYIRCRPLEEIEPGACVQACHLIYSLYWYTSTNTDAEDARLRTRGKHVGVRIFMQGHYKSRA